MTARRVVVGADVGGTSTRVGVATLDGEVLGLAVGAAGNPNSVGLVQSAAVIRDVTERALDGVRGSVTAVVIALAGWSRVAADPGFLRAAVPSSVTAQPLLVSDLTAAFYSATPGPRGSVLLAGTGAIAGQVSGTELVQQRDGWGWLLGDEGAGFWIGRASVRATLAALQRHQPLGPLGRDVLARSEATDYVSLLKACYERPPTWLAELAPLVSRHAAADPAAALIADDAAVLLLELLLSLAPRPGEPVVLAGSVLTANGPVSRGLRARLREERGTDPAEAVLSARSGVVGALWLALATACGAVTDPATRHETLRASALRQAQGTDRGQGAERAQGTDRGQGAEGAQGTDRGQGAERAQGTDRGQGAERAQGTDRGQG